MPRRQRSRVSENHVLVKPACDMTFFLRLQGRACRDSGNPCACSLRWWDNSILSDRRPARILFRDAVLRATAGFGPNALGPPPAFRVRHRPSTESHVSHPKPALQLCLLPFEPLPAAVAVPGHPLAVQEAADLRQAQAARLFEGASPNSFLVLRAVQLGRLHHGRQGQRHVLVPALGTAHLAVVQAHLISPVPQEDLSIQCDLRKCARTGIKAIMKVPRET